MPTIALVGNKGGAGKTTLSINLACGLNRRRPTILLDADPQRSSLQWRDIAGDDMDGKLVDVLEAQDDIHTVVAQNRDHFDFVVIDCPPAVGSEQTRQALLCSDMVIIPVLPSPLDLWASVRVEGELDYARSENPALRALMVVNQLEPRTRLSQLMRDALAEIDVPVANTEIRRRVAYRNAILQGCSVLDAGASARQAASEIEQFIDEVVNRL